MKKKSQQKLITSYFASNMNPVMSPLSGKRKTQDEEYEDDDNRKCRKEPNVVVASISIHSEDEDQDWMKEWRKDEEIQKNNNYSLYRSNTDVEEEVMEDEEKDNVSFPVGSQFNLAVDLTEDDCEETEEEDEESEEGDFFGWVGALENFYSKALSPKLNKSLTIQYRMKEATAEDVTVLCKIGKVSVENTEDSFIKAKQQAAKSMMHKIEALLLDTTVDTVKCFEEGWGQTPQVTEAKVKKPLKQTVLKPQQKQTKSSLSPTFRRYTQEQKMQIINECVENLTSPKDLSRKWGCGQDTIRNWVKKAGKELPRKYRKIQLDYSDQDCHILSWRHETQEGNGPIFDPDSTFCCDLDLHILAALDQYLSDLHIFDTPASEVGGDGRIASEEFQGALIDGASLADADGHKTGTTADSGNYLINSDSITDEDCGHQKMKGKVLEREEDLSHLRARAMKKRDNCIVG